MKERAVTKAEIRPVAGISFVNIEQPFFNLEQAWIIKGCVCAWNTFCRNRFIQPKGGFFDGYVGGRGVFKNETIREWLPLMDEDMEDYNRKYKTGAKSHNRIKKGRLLAE
jgi:hypothetical protein